MAEYIISGDFLEIVQKQAWHAGHSNVEPYKLNTSDGEEIIRCLDCRFCNPECKCTNPRWCYDNGAIMHCPKVEPNGFCAWAERSE